MIDCQYSKCDDAAEIEVRYIGTPNEKVYCVDHADQALEEFDDARLGYRLTETEVNSA